MQDIGPVHVPDPGHGAPARAGGGDAFHDLLVAALPRLRIHALSLTRNRAEADDLVQDAVTLALRNRDSFELGTNFEAWMYRILRNRFISLLRQRRGHADIDAVEARLHAELGHLLPAQIDDAEDRPAIAIDDAALERGVNLAGRRGDGSAVQCLDEVAIDRRDADLQAGKVDLVDLLVQIDVERHRDELAR